MSQGKTMNDNVINAQSRFSRNIRRDTTALIVEMFASCAPKSYLAMFGVATTMVEQWITNISRCFAINDRNVFGRHVKRTKNLSFFIDDPMLPVFWFYTASKSKELYKEIPIEEVTKRSEDFFNTFDANEANGGAALGAYALHQLLSIALVESHPAMFAVVYTEFSNAEPFPNATIRLQCLLDDCDLVVGMDFNQIIKTLSK